MAFWDALKRELIDIIEWNAGSSSDAIAWRFPRADNEIKNGAKLIVREGQMAIFVNMGQIADVFVPGMYTLKTENLPILSTLMGWKYGFDSPFKAEVYFVATRRFTDLKWGTANPFMLRDKEFGPLRLRAFGNYVIQVDNPAALLRQLIGTDPNFQTYEIAAQLKNIIVTRATDALASSGIPVLDMAGNLDELSKYVREKIGPDFAEMGLAIPQFFVENISLPPNVEEALDKRTSMGVIGNLDSYMKFQTANAISDAANNQSGGAAGLGAGLGAGMAMAQQMVGSMAPQQQASGPPAGMPPPLPTAAAWYAGIGGAQAGPFDAAGLQAQVSSGALTRETLVWKNGMAAWTPAGQVGELANLFASMPPPLPPG